MANVIKLKRGTSTPTTSDITSGEVALDTSAKKSKEEKFDDLFEDKKSEESDDLPF